LPTPGASAVQPFNLNPDGSLTPVSGPIGSGQIAVCWDPTGGLTQLTPRSDGLGTGQPSQGIATADFS